MRLAHWFVALAVVSATRSAQGAPPPLIPRDVLFGNPERAGARLSPDGKLLAWRAPDANNVLQVWIAPLGQHDGKMVTADKKRGIRSAFWSEDSSTVLYVQDLDGDENWHLYGVELKSGNIRDYTPFQGVRVQNVTQRPEFSDQVLVTMNLRDRSLMDVYRLTLSTGALVLDTTNPGDVASFNSDMKLQIRAAEIIPPEGGVEIRWRDDAQAPWRTWLKVGPDEILDFVGFSADGRSAYLSSSIGHDTARLVERDLATGRERVLATSDAVDVQADDVMTNPITDRVEAVHLQAGKPSWVVVDPSVKADFEALEKLGWSDFWVASRDHADAQWVVFSNSDQNAGRAFLWNRAERRATLLFEVQPKLKNYPLAKMEPVRFKARDGLEVSGYLTLPVGVPGKALPLVLKVHGGPWARDTWGFDNVTQFLANRGYAVLSVNYRGSTGYGKAHLKAGYRQWGLKMQDDLSDAVQWAIAQGYADPGRVAIWGASYGGYATLAGLAFTPDLFACGVDMVGPSNLTTLIRSIPPYWKPIRALFDVRTGNVDDPKDAPMLHDASPLFKADQIRRPLLIGQGGNDPRVKPAESEQIVSAITKRKGDVVYVLYSDEGHGFARPENRDDFNARTEQFLKLCIGGRAEPMAWERAPGSTAVVRSGGGSTPPNQP